MTMTKKATKKPTTKKLAMKRTTKKPATVAPVLGYTISSAALIQAASPETREPVAPLDLTPAYGQEPDQSPVAPVPVIIATHGRGKSEAEKLGTKTANWLLGMSRHYREGRPGPYVKSERAWSWPVEHAVKAAHAAALELEAQS
jgi:hypothetical protein